MANEKTNLTQTVISFKKLSGVTNTGMNRTELAETIASKIQLGTNTVFGEIPPVSPPSTMYETSSGAIVQRVEFDLVPIAGSTYNATQYDSEAESNVNTTHSFALKLKSNYETLGSNNPKVGTPPFTDGYFASGSNGTLQIVPPSFGSSYSIVLKDQNGVQITTGDEMDWYFDYYAGILFRQDGDNTTIPVSGSGYIYIGKYADEVISSGSATPLNTGSFLITASNNSGNNNITFTKGDTTTFDVAIISSSYALDATNASTASYVNTLNQDVTINGTVTADTGSFDLVTAQVLEVTYISSSVIYSSGSNIFGDELTDTQTLSGSVYVVGPNFTWNGNTVITTANTASMTVSSASYASTASYVETAQTASYVLNAVSSSFASTASYVLNAISSSFATTASYVQTAQTASYVLNAISSSFASTASYVLNAVSSSFASTASYVQTAQTASYVLNAVSSSFASTSSYVLNAVSSSFASTASYVQTAQTASYVLNAVSSSFASTASYVLNAVSSSFASTASYVQTAQTASYVLNAVSSSFASTASYVNTLNQDVTINGQLTANAGTSSFNNINITNNAIVNGDFFVYGSSSFINVNNLAIEDKFILLNSGSTGAVPNEGGIIVQTTSSEGVAAGTALFYDQTANRWMVAKSSSVDFNITNIVIGATTDYIVTVSASAGVPTGTPVNFGTGDSAYSVGQMYIQTDSSDIYIYA